MLQKSDVINFTWSLGHCTDINRDNALKFCTLVAGILYVLVIHFWGDVFKILELYDVTFERFFF